MRDLLNAVPGTNVRSLGAYYTPDSTASTIARWAIRTGDENLLEPSAGGGALLRAAFEQAKKISNAPLCQATAFDIDPVAIRNLNALQNERLTVTLGDFLEQTPKRGQTFDLILANPPFNRNHSLSPKLRNELRSKFSTKGAVGVWVYFLLHSLSYLKPGGRLASIVPRSALFTLHGRDFLNRLCKSFSSVGAYELENKPKWSSFAEEAGAVILAEGYLQGSCNEYQRGVLESSGAINIRTDVSSDVYLRILSCCKPLGDYAQISIGAVTGRNSVFLLSEQERAVAGIDYSDVLPVVSRRKQISGITISAAELEALAEKGQKTWLLSPKNINNAVSKYLKVISLEERKSVVWFKKRDPWWKVQVAEKYHAVFTYMNDSGPRLVRLTSGIVCTNTLHRVEFFDAISEDIKIAAYLTPISTFGQLAAEKLGRAYSGGVLKFEISEARQLPILFKDTSFDEKLLQKVDKFLRDGLHDSARICVDQAFMPNIFGRRWRQKHKELEAELHLLRNSRRGAKGGAQNDNK